MDETNDCPQCGKPLLPTEIARGGVCDACMRANYDATRGQPQPFTHVGPRAFASASAKLAIRIAVGLVISVVAAFTAGYYLGRDLERLRHVPTGVLPIAGAGLHVERHDCPQP